MPLEQPRSRVLFRIGGIEVAVHASWLIIFALLVIVARAEIVRFLVPPGSIWVMPLSVGIALLFYVFVLLHEISHALMARAHGLDARRVTLFVFGGVATIGSEAREPGDEFRIAIVGPLVSLMIAGVLLLAARLVHPAQSGFPGLWGILAFVNLALALFNLVPAFPLDGGRLLRAGLWGGLRDRAKATAWAATLGKAFAFSLIGAGGAIALIGVTRGSGRDTWRGVWNVLLGMFLFGIAGSAGRSEGNAEPKGAPPVVPGASDRAGPRRHGYRERR